VGNANDSNEEDSIMADKKISELTALTTPDGAEELVVNDGGTSKKITIDNILSNVDVADLADGTDGEIITWDASGNPATVGAGTSGQVLTSNGAGAAPTMQTVSAGADTSLSNLSATGEQKVAQAWVNFNGAGTLAIRDSYNVSSVTDNGTGDYTVNFSSNLANANYAVAGMAQNEAGTDNTSVCVYDATVQTTSAVRLIVIRHTSSITDSNYVNAVIFGDPS